MAHSIRSLGADLRKLGVTEGDVLMMHSSIRAVGYVAGGAQAVVQAVLDVLGPLGTLVVPTHTPENSDPAEWRNPPVPESWWPVIRSETPGFDPARTPSRWMGLLAETVRTWPGALRSNHPQVSCAAIGAHAATIVAEHPLDGAHGERSPLGAIYRLDGRVLLVGCGYGSNTSLHLAEARQPSPPRGPASAAILRPDGSSAWTTWVDMLADEDDFGRLGEDFEATGRAWIGRVGEATSRLMAQRELVDFATAWMSDHRTGY